MRGVSGSGDGEHQRFDHGFELRQLHAGRFFACLRCIWGNRDFVAHGFPFPSSVPGSRLTASGWCALYSSSGSWIGWGASVGRARL